MNHQDPKLLRIIGSRVQPHFGWDLFLLGNIGETLLKASSRQLYVYAVAYLSHILHVVGVCSQHSVHLLSSRVLMFSMPRYHQMKPQYYLVCSNAIILLSSAWYFLKQIQGSGTWARKSGSFPFPSLPSLFTWVLRLHIAYRYRYHEYDK